MFNEETSNPFDILGLDNGASEAEINKAFKKLARQLHPDKNKNNPAAVEQMKDVNAAYTYLKNNGWAWNGYGGKNGKRSSSSSSSRSSSSSSGSSSSSSSSSRSSSSSSGSRSSSSSGSSSSSSSGKKSNNSSSGRGRRGYTYSDEDFEDFMRSEFFRDSNWGGSGHTAEETKRAFEAFWQAAGGYRRSHKKKEEEQKEEEPHFDMPDPVAGTDINKDVKVTLKQAQFGAKFKLNYSRYKTCPHCNGKAYIGEKPVWKKCSKCNGKGKSGSSECPNCGGTGYVLDNECPHCKDCNDTASGRVIVQDSVTVELPANIRASHTIRVQGGGHSGKFGHAKCGDYVVRFVVDPKYGRLSCKDGNASEVDLCVEVNVPLHKAIVGGKFGVPTLDGAYEIELPAGLRDGVTIKLTGKGRKVSDKTSSGSTVNITGDLLVKTKHEMPKNLSVGAKMALAAVIGQESYYPDYEKYKEDIEYTESKEKHYDKNNNPYTV